MRYEICEKSNINYYILHIIYYRINVFNLLIVIIEEIQLLFRNEI